MLLNAEQSCFVLVDVQEKLIPTIYQHQNLIANCEWLLNLCNQLKVPVFISEQYPQGLGSTVPTLKNLVNENYYSAKTTFSCAADEACLEKINSLNKSQVVMAGIEAHVCVLQSAIDLSARGKQVFVVSDAIASRNLFDKEMALQRMRAAGIQIVTKEMVLFEWLRHSRHPKFKELSKMFLQ